MATYVICAGGDDLDRLNNWLQALALLQHAAGTEVTAASLGLRYHVKRDGGASSSDANTSSQVSTGERRQPTAARCQTVTKAEKLAS